MDIRHFFGTKKPKPKPKEIKKVDEVPINDIGKLEPDEPSDDDIVEDDAIDKFMVGKYNMYNMVLKRQRKNYQILVKHKNNIEKIRFGLSWLRSPFGVEEYAHKEIVNLEFPNHLKNNLSHNNFTIIRQIDDAFKDISKEKFPHLPHNFIQDIEGLSYSPLIKPRPGNYDPLVRIHLRKTKNTITTRCYKKDSTNGKLEDVSIYEIKGHMVEIEFELGSLWVSDDSYGVILIANRVIILN